MGLGEADFGFCRVGGGGFVAQLDIAGVEVAEIAEGGVAFVFELCEALVEFVELCLEPVACGGEFVQFVVAA